MNIYIAADITKSDTANLQQKFNACSFLSKANMNQAQVIFGNPSAPEIKDCKSLLWLQTVSAGVDLYMQPGILPPGCTLTNATGAYGPAISEHLLAMHLALLKKLHLYRDLQSKGQWQDLGAVAAINGATVLVVGLGDIGSAYAKLVKAMGATVIGLRRTDITAVPFADEVYGADQLMTQLPRADAVAIALPGTAQTQGLFGKQALWAMKPGAILLNVGRGIIVDTAALCDALMQGQIGGAGLDVTDPEPLPARHPLWQIPNAIITPHISGGYHLPETGRLILQIFTKNLCRFLNGTPLVNVVDFATGYRKIQQ